MQGPALMLLDTLSVRFAGVRLSAAPTALATLASLLITVALAWLAIRCWDTPVRAWLTAWFRRAPRFSARTS